MAEKRIHSKRERKYIAKITDYQKAFGTPEGKRVLLDLINHTGFLNGSMKKDPMELAHMQGERSVVLKIMSHLKTDIHELYRRMEDAHAFAQSDSITE